MRTIFKHPGKGDYSDNAIWFNSEQDPLKGQTTGVWLYPGQSVVVLSDDEIATLKEHSKKVA